MPTLVRRFALPFVLLVVHATLLAYGATRYSFTVDEVGHMAAGLLHVNTGKGFLFRAEPPLARIAAGLAVSAARPKTDWRTAVDFPGARPEMHVGRALIRANGRDSWRLLAYARWACIPFSLLTGLVIYAWTLQLSGTRAATCALVLWCFCPHLLGHGSLVNVDIAAGATGLSACYAFWKWRQGHSWKWAVLSGLGLGLAALARVGWLGLFLIWPLLGLTREPSGRSSAQLAVSLLIAGYTINLTYGLEGSWKPLRDYQFVSHALSGLPVAQPNTLSNSGNRFRDSFLGRLPVPLPSEYLKGIDQRQLESEQGEVCYLLGRFKTGAWASFPLYAIVLKTTLGVLGLALLAAASAADGITRRGRLTAPSDRPHCPPELICATLLWAILVLLDRGHNRFGDLVVLLPIVYLVLGQWAAILLQRGRWPATFTVSLLAASVISSLASFPHTLGYFNELAGGTHGGSRYLLWDSVDIGQDLRKFEQWYAAHPEARPLRLAYFGSANPQALGVEAPLLRSWNVQPYEWHTSPAPEWELETGWYAISASYLRGRDCRRTSFRVFQNLEPVGYAAPSIWIFYVDSDLASRGLPARTLAAKDD